MRLSVPLVVRRCIDWVRHHVEVVVASIGILLSGVTAVVGAAHVPGAMLFLGGIAVTGLGTFLIRTLEKSTPEEKLRNLTIAMVFALSIPIGAATYHFWFDPSSHAPTYVSVVVDGTDVDVVRPVGEPGSQEFFDYPPVIGGTQVDVDCKVLYGGVAWYRLASNHSFLPATAVHAIRGVKTPSPPLCRATS
jgi:hypothetical protein